MSPYFIIFATEMTADNSDDVGALHERALKANKIRVRQSMKTTEKIQSMRRMASRTICLMTLLSLSLSCYSQEKKITLSFGSPAELEGCTMYLKPLTAESNAESIAMTKEGGNSTATVKSSPVSLYMIACVRNNTQILSTIHAEGEQPATIPVKFQDSNIVATDTENNRAISSYAVCETEGMKALWSGTQNPDELKGIILRTKSKADSILSAHRCSQDIAEYIKMWANVTAGKAYSSLPHIMRCKASEIPFSIEDVMGNPKDLFDNPRALLFPETVGLISSFIPRDKPLTEQLGWINENFKCKDVSDKVSDGILNGYVSRFDYAGKYEQGLAMLKEATEKYQLDGKYLKKFISNRATIQGSPFPEGLTFTDKEGKTHTIDEFKGKYIYIDLWASWCVPCCKEVPHLQALEKELDNPNVVFLSISIDQKAQPWLKKMEELNMHGNQWHDAKSTLPSLLNVRGIPFFLIYDKEGRLYQYNAPRPSHPQLKALLEELK